MGIFASSPFTSIVAHYTTLTINKLARRQPESDLVLTAKQYSRVVEHASARASREARATRGVILVTQEW